MADGTGSRPNLLVLETRGEHLSDNADTNYKSRVMETLENAFNCGQMTVQDSPLKGTFRLVFEEDEFPAVLADLQ